MILFIVHSTVSISSYFLRHDSLEKVSCDLMCGPGLCCDLTCKQQQIFLQNNKYFSPTDQVQGLLPGLDARPVPGLGVAVSRPR